MTVAHVRHWLPEYEDGYADADCGTARIEDDLLEALPLQLPSEAEWEHGAPGRHHHADPRGDGKPGEDQLLGDFGGEERTAAADNAVRADRERPG